MLKERDLFVDFLKGCAITLVVLGHVIQFSDLSQPNFFQNYFFKAIYLFHMPLFIFISGYVSYKVAQGSFAKFTVNRLVYLGVPMLIGSFLFTLIYVLKTRFSEDIIVYLSFLKDYLTGAFWYIYVLIYCNLVTYFINKEFKDNTAIIIASVILSMLLPDFYYLLYFKFMYPFYIMGYLCKRESIKIWSLNKIVVGVNLIIYTTCYYVWENSFFIYNCGNITSWDNEIVGILIRLLAGGAGIILFSNLIFKAKEYIPNCLNNKIIKLGRITLGVYIYQTIFFSLLNYIRPELEINFWLYNLICVPVVSIILIISISLAINIISKNKVMGKLLFGLK